MFRDINDPGVVAITLKKVEAVVLIDSEGNRIAAVMTTKLKHGKMQVVVCANKSIRVKREKEKPNEVA